MEDGGGGRRERKKINNNNEKKIKRNEINNQLGDVEMKPVVNNNH